MPQTLTGSAPVSYVNQCSAPTPGDFITAASVSNGLQACLDLGKYLYDKKVDRAGDTMTGTLVITGSASTNNGAISATGDGSGPGVTGSGSVSGSGAGVVGVGGGGNGAGGDFQGTGSGKGINAQGGSSAGTGVACAGGTAGWALDVGTGGATFSGTAPTKTADPGAHALFSSNVPKAWGQIETDGLTNIAYNDGHGITSAVLNIGGWIDVTFSHAFADRKYIASALSLKNSTDGKGTDSPSSRFYCDIISTTVVRIYATDLSGSARDPKDYAFLIDFKAFGRQ